MFGYVKPYVPELRVREHELYRALYCGLCRSMGRCTGCLSRLTLSYDFVFLALVRASLMEEAFAVKASRCAVHPLKKRPSVYGSEALDYSARVSAALTLGKLRDDIADEHGFKRMRAAAMLPFAARSAKRAGLPPELRDAITASLTDLAALEKAGSDSIDDCADTFGRLLSAVCAHDLPKNQARIAAEIGMHTGRWLYVIDAVDDAPADAASDSFNPTSAVPLDSLHASLLNELSLLNSAAALCNSTLITNITQLGLANITEAVCERRRGNALS